MTENMTLYIISIFGGVITIFSFVCFTLCPYIKNKMINNTFVNIYKFYNIYQYLNPSLLWNQNMKDITTALRHQSFLANGFPRFKYLIINNNFDFDPFNLESSYWKKTLTLKEILYFRRFWKKALKKIIYIKNIINAYEYIMEVKNHNSDDKKRIVYRDSFEEKIKNSSISLCPTFDSMKLYSFIIREFIDYEEKKIDLNTIDKSEKSHEFLKELRSKKFSINLKFYDDSGQKEKSTFYSYSIFFDNNRPVEVETFLHKNISYLLNVDVLKMKSHLDWIDKTFNIKSILLMKIKNFILKNKSFDFNNL